MRIGKELNFVKYAIFEGLITFLTKQLKLHDFEGTF